jgi:Uma2 family endonuclease
MYKGFMGLFGMYAQEKSGMSLQAFTQRWDELGPFELIDGEVVPVSPTKMFAHTTSANRLMYKINSVAIPAGIGEAFVEGTFITVLPTDPNWVKGSRVPDVLYVTADRLSAYKQASPEWEGHPLALVPDLVAEVISENDNYREVMKKVAQYLRDGVRLLWLLEPETRTISIHRPNSKQVTILSGEDKLEGEDVIPGFEISLPEIFG